jgi:glycopeptide antibiotics resistance protein
MQYFSGNSAEIKAFAFGNVIGNIVLFVPLGIYLAIFRNDKRVRTSLLIIFIVSLSVEIIQGLFGIGTADIDDIILNCLGGWIGILGYKLLFLIVRDEKKVQTAITILSAIIGLPAIFYFLFIVKMRF